jgi:hypothetical protein
MMNERIKELADEAKMSTYLLAYGLEFNISIEKFAELIIQDCLSQIAMIGISNFENDDHGDISWTVDKCIEMIKSRFG